MSIESKTSGSTTKYRGIAQVKGDKQHTPWVSSRSEAVMLEAELKIAMGGQVVRSGHTVRTVVTGYIESRDGALSPATLTYYRAGAGSIPTVFGDRLVSDMSPVLLDSLYAELRKSGVTSAVAKRMHATLSVSFSRAVKYGWMQSNPCRSATTPRTKVEEIVPPTPAAVKRTIAAAVAVNADLSACLRLAAASGMRRSELVALQWRDLGDSQIIIRRNRVKDGSGYVTRSTKSGSRSHRTINIDSATLTALEEVRARQADQVWRCPWIFSHDGVEPWRPEYLTHSYAGIETDGSSIHGFRHFHATQLLSTGVPVATVSHRLGHSSPLVTMNTYAHWIPANDQASADFIGALLN